jgi:predicted nucleic-acid-binding Zn-ribbon protein
MAYKFTCPKCGCTKYQVLELRSECTLKGFLTPHGFQYLTHVICNDCRFCETYQLRETKFREMFD